MCNDCNNYTNSKHDNDDKYTHYSHKKEIKNQTAHDQLCDRNMKKSFSHSREFVKTKEKKTVNYLWDYLNEQFWTV